jgi:hypothetical protein
MEADGKRRPDFNKTSVAKMKQTRNSFLSEVDASDVRKMLKEIGLSETMKNLSFKKRGDFAKFCKRKGISISLRDFKNEIKK